MAAYFQTSLRPEYEQAVLSGYRTQQELDREAVLSAQAARTQGTTAFDWARQDRATEAQMRQAALTGGRGLTAMLKSLGQQATQTISGGFQDALGTLAGRRDWASADILKAGAQSAANWLMGAAGRGMGGTTSARLTAAGMGQQAQEAAAKTRAEFAGQIAGTQKEKALAEAGVGMDIGQMLAQAAVQSPEMMQAQTGSTAPPSGSGIAQDQIKEAASKLAMMKYEATKWKKKQVGGTNWSPEMIAAQEKRLKELQSQLKGAEQVA